MTRNPEKEPQNEIVGTIGEELGKLKKSVEEQDKYKPEQFSENDLLFEPYARELLKSAENEEAVSNQYDTYIEEQETVIISNSFKHDKETQLTEEETAKLMKLKEALKKITVRDQLLQDDVSGINAIHSAATPEDRAAIREQLLGHFGGDRALTEAFVQKVLSEETHYRMMNRLSALKKVHEVSPELHSEYLQATLERRDDPEELHREQSRILEEAARREQEQYGTTHIAVQYLRSLEPDTLSFAGTVEKFIPMIAAGNEKLVPPAAKETLVKLAVISPVIAKDILRSGSIQGRQDGSIISRIEGEDIVFQQEGSSVSASIQAEGGKEFPLKKIHPDEFDRVLCAEVIPWRMERSNAWNGGANKEKMLRDLYGIDLHDRSVAENWNVQFLAEHVGALPKSRDRVVRLYRALGVIDTTGRIRKSRAELFSRQLKYLSDRGPLHLVPVEDFYTIAQAWNEMEKRGEEPKPITAQDAERMFMSNVKQDSPFGRQAA